jgi:hypothetical protein
MSSVIHPVAMEQLFGNRIEMPSKPKTISLAGQVCLDGRRDIDDWIFDTGGLSRKRCANHF